MLEVSDDTWIQVIATLLVGLSAWFLYNRGKRDETRAAARVLLTEIREAELQMEKIGENIDTASGSLARIVLLPSFDGWKAVRHILTRRHWWLPCLSTDEISYLNRMFNRYEIISKMLEAKEAVQQAELEAKAEKIQEVLSDAFTSSQGETEEQKRNRFEDLKGHITDFAADSTQFLPKKFPMEITRRLQGLNEATITSAGDKLRRIADSWF